MRIARSAGPLWRILALVAGIGLWLGAPGSALGSAPGSGVAAAASTAGPAAGAALPLSLVSQSPFVTTAEPAFAATLAVGAGAPALSKLSLTMTVYARLPTRSALDQTLGGTTPQGNVLDAAQAIAVTSTRPAVHAPVSTGAAGDTPGAPAIALDCTPRTGSCPGVYPVTFVLSDTGSGVVVGHLTTYLTYAESASSVPLRVAVVVPFGTPVTIRHTASPGLALAPVPGADAAALSTVAASLARYAPTAAAGVPVTVAVDPRTLQDLRAAGSAGAQAVRTLSTLSLTPGGDEFPLEPYVRVDVGALARAGLTGEITLQVQQGAGVLRADAVRAATAPPTSCTVAGRPAGATWVALGGVGQDLGEGLLCAGADHVVVPDTAVSPDPARLGITQTFSLPLGRTAPVTAAVADSGLAAHFAADPRDPVLAANQMLADLALIQLSYPAVAGRGVVAVPAGGRVPSAAFLDALLNGLSGHPDVRAVTLSAFFNEVPTGGYVQYPALAEPAVRHLVGDDTPMPSSVARQVSTARLRNGAFDRAVLGDPPVRTQLESLLLASESSWLRTPGQSAGLATYERSLAAQLSQFQLGSDRSITLTARTAPIPVTILSSAGYGMVGDLTLASDKFQFPEGATRPNFAVTRNTNSVRIVVEARTTGNLPLEVTLTAPDPVAGAPPLVLTHGVLTVRSTATSVVGILLTLVAALVLGAWWARTWWRGRSGRSGPARHH